MKNSGQTKQLELFSVQKKRGRKKKAPVKPKKSKKVDKEKRWIYYCHTVLKNLGFRIDAANRTVDVSPYTTFAEIPTGPRYYVNQLLKRGYNIQLKLV